MYALKFEVPLTIFYFFLPQISAFVENIPNFIYVFISHITGMEESVIKGILPGWLKDLIETILHYFIPGEQETTTQTPFPTL
jgi:hypothetical protein